MSKERLLAHRRTLAAGIGVSVLAHVALLLLVTVRSPLPHPDVQVDKETPMVPASPALTVVRIAEASPTPTAIDVSTAASAAAASTTSRPDGEPALALGDLTVESPAKRIPAATSSRPITMAAIAPLEPSGPPAGSTARSEEESRRGGRPGGVTVGGWLGGTLGGAGGLDRCTPGLRDLIGRMRPGAVTAVNNRVPTRRLW